jgi:flagellar assembly protein FliH
MAIIKNYDASTLLKGALVLDLGDVARQAKRMREAAQQQAHQLIAQAKDEVEVLRSRVHKDSEKQGYEQGYERGLAEGRQQGLEEGHKEAYEQAGPRLEMIQQGWLDAADKWDQMRLELDREARRAVLELALRLAERVVGRVIKMDEGVIEDQLSSVLVHVLRPLDVTVSICMDDRPVLERAMPRLLREFSNVKHVSLTDSPSVSRGGCVVSFGQGCIDATIEKQMQRLLEMLVPGAPVAAEPSGLGTEDSQTQAEGDAPGDTVVEGGDV